ncbi:MAG: hypothetical protein DYH08_17055 [Actinobacteria bacterium ATB1]|nr:hypothetical protein [Actinobacteria bacterium ATB1]
MKLKSRGLGRKELTMDFREYTVVREGNEIVILGTIREPVHWDFTIRMCEDDLAGVTRVALQRPTLGLLLRAAFKRNKDAHWSVDRKEQIAAAKEARKELLEREAAKASDTSEGPDTDEDAEGSSRADRRRARKAERAKAKAEAAANSDTCVESGTDTPVEISSVARRTKATTRTNADEDADEAVESTA